MSDWMYIKDGVECGPVTDKGLKELATQGQLKRTDMVWRDGLPEWVAAGKIKGLFAGSPPMPPTPSPPAQAASSPKPESVGSKLVGLFNTGLDQIKKAAADAAEKQAAAKAARAEAAKSATVAQPTPHPQPSASTESPLSALATASASAASTPAPAKQDSLIKASKKFSAAAKLVGCGGILLVVLIGAIVYVVSRPPSAVNTAIAEYKTSLERRFLAGPSTGVTVTDAGVSASENNKGETIPDEYRVVFYVRGGTNAFGTRERKCYNVWFKYDRATDTAKMTEEREVSSGFE